MDWWYKLRKKLSSRKLWAGITAWLTATLSAFHVATEEITQVVLIVSGIGSLITYMLAQAHVDAVQNGHDDNPE